MKLNDSPKLRLRCGLVFLALAVSAAVWAAGQPCQSNVPECQDVGPGAPGSACGGVGGAVWVSGGDEPYTYYACNGKNGKCPNDAGNCNTYVKYTGTGRTMTCETDQGPIGAPTYCMVQVNTITPLNTKCDDGTACDSTKPADTIPSGYGPQFTGNPQIYVPPSILR